MRPLCLWERGEVILDETVISKPCATAMAGRAWARPQKGGSSACSLSV